LLWLLVSGAKGEFGAWVAQCLGDVCDSGNDVISGRCGGHGDLCWKPGECVTNVLCMGLAYPHDGTAI